jgi:hypothetical protein
MVALDRDTCYYVSGKEAERMRWLDWLGQPDWATLIELAFATYEIRHHHWVRRIRLILQRGEHP